MVPRAGPAAQHGPACDTSKRRAGPRPAGLCRMACLAWRHCPGCWGAALSPAVWHAGPCRAARALGACAGLCSSCSMACMACQHRPACRAVSARVACWARLGRAGPAAGAGASAGLPSSCSADLSSLNAALTLEPPLTVRTRAQNRLVSGQDPVAWLAFGVLHYPRIEDFPIMCGPPGPPRQLPAASAGPCACQHATPNGTAPCPAWPSMPVLSLAAAPVK